MNPRQGVSSAIVIALTLFHGFSHADVLNGKCQVKVLDGASREEKTYSPGDQPVEIPIAGVPGWTKCRMSQLKKIKLEGQDGVRVDLWCFASAGGAVINASAVGVASPGLSFGVTVIDLLGGPVAFRRQSGEDVVNSTGGYKMITIACKA